jgi:hypothetical protein
MSIKNWSLDNMITTTLTWYSVKEKLPSETDNILFITKKSNSNLQLINGYYNITEQLFIEEDSALNNVTSWVIEDVAYWTVVSNSTFYSKFDQKLLEVEV